MTEHTNVAQLEAQEESTPAMPSAEPSIMPPMVAEVPLESEPEKGPKRTDAIRQQVKQEMANYRKQLDGQFTGLREQMGELVNKFTDQGQHDNAAHAQADIDQLDAEMADLDDEDFVDAKTVKKLIMNAGQSGPGIKQEIEQVKAQLAAQNSSSEYWSLFSNQFPGVDGRAIWADIEAEARAAGFTTDAEIRAYGHKPFSDAVIKVAKNAKNAPKGTAKSIAGATTQTPGASTASATPGVDTDAYGIPQLVD